MDASLPGLADPLPPPIFTPLTSQQALSDADLDLDIQPVVEEPESSAPEVRMKNTSWYEPEKDRIVILDLDSDEEEDADSAVQTSSNSTQTELQVSSTLLSAIRRSTIPPPIPQNASQALVLYRPSQWTRPTNDIAETKSPDEDAMEIEL